MISTFRQYLKDISKYPLLTAEEEKELAFKMRDKAASDSARRAARERLVNSNLRLVISIAKNYENSHLTFEDLISEGNVGLITAVDKFNPEFGYRFSTYATPWIKQAITKAIIDNGHSVRIPAHMFQLMARYRRTLAELGSDGHHVTDEELEKALEIDNNKLELVRKWLQDTVSLSTIVGGGDGDGDKEKTLEDYIPDRGITPYEYAAKEDKTRRLQALIDEMKPRTATIVRLRFGFGREGIDAPEFFQEHTLEEVGAIVGLTRERVRQILKEATGELYTKIKARKLIF